MRLIGFSNGVLNLLQEPRLVSAQGAFQDEPIGGVVAPEDRAFQFESRQKIFHFNEKFMLRKRFPFRKVGTESGFTLGEAHYQRGQIFRLCGIGQPR
jgi:hypothetical protein